MSERELVILAEVDQAEAFAPILALRKARLGIGVAVALVVALLGLFFARTITRPVLQLVRGTEEVGRGNLEYRIELRARDEIGQLATAFNEMAADLHRSLGMLRESEAKYRNLTESLDELIYRADPETFVATYVNRAVEKICGYTVEEWLGDPTLWESTIHPEDKERVFAWFTEAQRKMESGAVEYRIIRKDKTVRWVEDHVSWEKDQQGNVVSLNGVLYDITERKQAEEKTKQLQEYLHLQIERMPIGLIVWDTEFCVTSWNPAAEKIFGFTAQEALGKHPYGLIVPKEAQPHVDDIWRCLLEGDTTAHSINDNMTKDGRTIICQWSNTPLRNADDTVRGVLSMVQDITERRRAEEALDRRVTELSVLNAMSSIVNESVDVDEILNLAMDKVLRLVGVETAGMMLLDEEAGELALVAHRGLSDEFVRAFSRLKLGEGLAGQAAQTGKSVILERVEDYPQARKAYVEQERIKSAASVPLIGPKGVIGAMSLGATSPQYFDAAGLELLVSLGQQIATGVEKARLYAETRAWAGELERRVAERTAELKAANKELESFSYSVSHDLRAPLRAIDGFSRILFEEYQPQLAPEAQRYLQLVRDNTQQMGRLIDDLLMFSRLGRQQIKKQPVAPSDLVHQALEDLRSQQDGRRVEISIGDPSAGSGRALPVCQADPSLLKQVWVNLLSNALKFTSKREVAVIEIGCRDERGEHVYFVKDNGVGFDMRYAHKLFGVFQRLHRAEEYEGTGVGLATVERIIHRHGGRVWAEAEVDKGATFYFTLEGGTPHD